jgi:serine/threonine protein kinase
MGVVRRAHDERLDRDVAVKLIHARGDSASRARFERETRLLGRLQHPNLVAALDTGVEGEGHDAVVWLAMELVDGPDLGAVLRAGTPSDDDVRRILTDVAAGLAAVHAAGVVHRDVKPPNILLTRAPGTGSWHAKLADLGIARLLDAEPTTESGIVVGTAAYLAPEQVSGGPITTATDVYALGLVALEALTGVRAFPGTAIESALARLARGPEVPPWIEGGWRGLLTSMTATDPGARPDAAQVESAAGSPLPRLVRPATRPPADPLGDDIPTTRAAEVLEPTVVAAGGATERIGTLAVPVEARGRRRIGAGALAAAVVVAGAVAVGAVLAPHPSAAPEPSTATPSSTVAPVVRRTASPAPSTSQAASRPSVTPSTTQPRTSTGSGSSGKGSGKSKGKGNGKSKSKSAKSGSSGKKGKKHG